MANMRDGAHHSRFENEKFLQENELHHFTSNSVEQGLVTNTDESIDKMNTQSKTLSSRSNEEIIEDEIGVRQCFVDFCRQTILHGWHYLIENGDSSDSESDKSDIICPPTPKECGSEKRGYYPNQCSCHHTVSAQNSRNKYVRNSTNKARNHSKKPYNSHHTSSQNSMSRPKTDRFDEPGTPNIWEENGTSNNHRHFTTSHSSRPRIHHVHARLSTNAIEGINGSLDDGIGSSVTTSVSITHQQIPQKQIRYGQRIPVPQSPPYADATDSDDDNSEECEERIDERIPAFNPPNYCSNQPQKRYCSLQCFKAAESNTSFYPANSTALAINPLASPPTPSAPPESAFVQSHPSIIDTLEHGSRTNVREITLLSNQTVRQRSNAHRKQPKSNCLCCCIPKRLHDKKHKNCEVANKQNNIFEKCQTTRYNHKGEAKTVSNKKDLYTYRKKKSRLNAFRSAFWTLIVMFSVVAGGFFLSNNTSEFLNATVQTTLDGSVPLSEVFFPSVVVCNINQIRKSFFEELGFYENDTLVRIMYEDFIKGTIETEIAERNGNDPKRTGFHDVLKQFLEKRKEKKANDKTITKLSRQNCDDMFIYSRWNHSTTYDFGENPRDFGTDYGWCCWYTPQLNFSAFPYEGTNWAEVFNSVPKGAKTGKDNGYTMLFDIESFDYGYYDEGSEGLKVAVVHHLDMPIIRQRAFHVAPGTENQIPVTPTLYTTTEQALERFTPAQRDCYRESEIDLMYLPKSWGYRYEMSNCLFEAAYEKILAECTCAPYFHSEGGQAAFESFDVCNGTKLSCMNNILNRMGEYNEVYDTVENKTKVCLTNCEDQINDLFVTTSSYPNKKTFKEREEFCLLLRKLLGTCSGYKRKPFSVDYPDLCPTIEMLPNITDYCTAGHRFRSDIFQNKTMLKNIEYQIYKYARENLATINIFIKESYTKRFRKTEKMSRISYIASSGGLLGLCMGFSFVSLAEILYHCFLCIAMVIRHESSKLLRKDLWKNKENANNSSSATQENGQQDRDRVSTTETRFIPPKHTLL